MGAVALRVTVRVALGGSLVPFWAREGRRKDRRRRVRIRYLFMDDRILMSTFKLLIFIRVDR
jgi:hypothetical protein